MLAKARATKGRVWAAAAAAWAAGREGRRWACGSRFFAYAVTSFRPCLLITLSVEGRCRRAGSGSRAPGAGPLVFAVQAAEEAAALYTAGVAALAVRAERQGRGGVEGVLCNSLHSSNKDWRCLSVKPAELQRSYPHLDISPGGWVGKRTNALGPGARGRRKSGAACVSWGVAP